MIVPRFWAEARLQERRDGRQRTLRRFGWSNESQAAAQEAADQRVAAAMADAWAGKSVDARELKVAYNGADGLPIREEIVAEHGATVITRNSYGARCLNTPDVLIADVDFAPRTQGVLEAAGCLGVLLLALGLWVWLGALWVAVQLAFAVAIAAAVALQLARWLRVRLAGGPERLARGRLTTFLASHPEWRVHVYRTPAGLRLIATHRRFAADEPAVKDFFAALHVDPQYRNMSRLQHCFRARLTAKPWRIGVDAHLKPRPGVWPVRAERLPERTRWLEDYERRAAGFAACEYLETIGAAAGDAEAEQVRLLHDELCRAHAKLPIA